MGKTTLIGRLAARDIRRHPAQAVLLLLAITAATSILTLGLALHGVASQPFQQTRAATNGPDVVAQIGGPDHSGPHGPAQAGPDSLAQVQAQARALERAPGVTGHSGPYLMAAAVIRAGGRAALVEFQGRGQAPAPVDQPEVTAGRWVSDGAVVLERTFGEALGVGPGDRVTLNGRPYLVAGLAVTAASPPYPNLCQTGCSFNGPPNPPANQSARDIGTAWVGQADARALAAQDQFPPAYVVNLTLRDPATAQAFASRYGGGSNPPPTAPTLTPWQQISTADALLITDQQQVLSVGAWLAGVLAVASVAVLAGGRMAEHTRRVGLLKAVGSTPGLVAAVLLAENLLLALAAGGAGLLIGWAAAPLITSPGAGLVGTAGAPSLTLPAAALVVGVAMLVALAATLVPALRAVRASTVTALADAPRPPRRRAALIKLSARLPVPLLFGLRLVARRPRRALLGAASIAVTVTGLVAVLAFHTMAGQGRYGGGSGLGDPVVSRDEQMLLVMTVALVALAVLNAVFTAWAAVLDSRHASALARALGATPQQVSGGLAAAQALPALAGALAGVPLGIGLFKVANGSGQEVIPSAPWLIAVVLGTLVAVTILTNLPARIVARRPSAEVLRAESA